MALKNILSVLAIATATLCAPAQDKETYVFDGSFTPARTGSDAGLNFWVKSVEPFEAVVMGAEPLTITGRPSEDALAPDEAYMTFASAGYAGDVVIPPVLQLESCSYVPVGIGYGAFANCTGLTSVALPRYLTTLSRGAFYGCTALAEVTQARIVPNKKPGNAWWCTFFPDAFRGCTALRKADISNADFVWDGIFADCPALEEVTVSTAGNQLNAFRGHNTTALRAITCVGKTPGQYTDTSVFTEAEYAAVDVTVPAGSLAAYRAHPVWGRFAKLHE